MSTTESGRDLRRELSLLLLLVGALGVTAGYPAVFVAAACLAVCNFTAASFVKTPRRAARPVVAEVETEAAGLTD